MSAIQGFQLSQGGDIERYDYNALDNKLELDTTLQISGQAADAKSTGDKINTVESNLSNLINDNSNSTISTWSGNKITEEINNLINNDTSTPSSDTTWSSAVIRQQIEHIARDSILSSMDGNNNVFSLLDLIYPIGSIFMTVNNVNPASYIENTSWVLWGSGRVPVGVDTSQTEFNTVEKTGGEKTHTLTESEIPAHTHTVHDTYPVVEAPIGVVGGPNSIHKIDKIDSLLRTTSSVGSGESHNNLQPYITCYMWKRVE